MKNIVLMMAAAALSFTVAAQTPKLSKDNIDQVVKAMTLQEKAKLLVGTHGTGGAFSAIGRAAALVPGAAGETQAIERLGIPATVLSDGPAGLRITPKRPNDSNTYYCTGFPVGTLLASTWNKDLVTSVGKAMGNEVLEYGADVLLAPGMCINRNPLCGRNFEYYSEDPLLSGMISTSMVKGLQSNGVGVSIKHYAANNQETNRMANDAVVSQRALREIYLKGFEIAVRNANPWTVMSSYNKINGKFTQEDPDLLTTILRDEWGYKGIVMTDWTMQRNTAAQVHAGNDLMEPGMQSQEEDIIAKVKSGELKESDVDVCVKRILEYIVKTPRFNGYKYSNKPDLKAHAEVTRESATEGMVLLKNDNNALPLKSGLKDIALFGVTSYDFIAGGTGSGDVNKAYVINLLQGLSNAGYGVNAQLKDLYEKYKAYENAQSATQETRGFMMGKAVLPEMAVSDNLIKNLAGTSDIAIITIGRNAGEGADRHILNDFELSQTERDLLTNVCSEFHKVGKKVVVLMNIGGAIETNSWKTQPDAILCAWQPGQEGGNSVADVLSGKVNPSGKLTATFPINYMDVPSSLNFPYDGKDDGMFGMSAAMSMFGRRGETKNTDYTEYAEDIYVGYRYFNTAKKAVSYPFGFGLSYTTFAYSNAKVAKSGDGWNATVTVKNTGKVAGKEVVELFVTAPKGAVEKPACELKAFAKTKALAPGESETVTMHFSDYDLSSYVQSRSSWVADKGQYTAHFCTNVNESRANVSFSLAKELVIKVHDVMNPVRKLDTMVLK
jgi:beta-glucosidase